MTICHNCQIFTYHIVIVMIVQENNLYLLHKQRKVLQIALQAFRSMHMSKK